GVDQIGGTVGPVCDTAAVDVIEPELSIAKTVDFNNDGVFGELETYYAGADADWKIVVTNTGADPVYDIYVTDDNGTNYGPFNLAAGASQNVPLYTTNPMADFTNEACAEGVDQIGGTVGPVCDTAAVDVIEPELSIAKTVDFDGDGVYTDSETNTAGATASWNVTVCNTGDVPVYSINVSDTNGYDFNQGVLFDLNPGECQTFIYDMVMNVDTVNTACAEGVNEIGGTVGPVCDAAEVIMVVGDQGCTPGFWKVQPKFDPPHCWCDTYDPTDLVSTVFTTMLGPDLQKKKDGAPDTLNEALAYGGGNGVEGAARNLLRSAVAAVLNACNDNVNYPMGEQAVIDAVNAALATQDRGVILALHSELDGYNNLGCSIDNHCNPILAMVD
ncbi:MAG: hypothetical protein MUP90_03900, partial [Gammaproteobacteria bacterium]|nr:hypothetical protein [Gammaproteobacteria bacterium]